MTIVIMNIANDRNVLPYVQSSSCTRKNGISTNTTFYNGHTRIHTHSYYTQLCVTRHALMHNVYVLGEIPFTPSVKRIHSLTVPLAHSHT